MVPPSTSLCQGDGKSKEMFVQQKYLLHRNLLLFRTDVQSHVTPAPASMVGGCGVISWVVVSWDPVGSTSEERL